MNKKANSTSREEITFPEVDSNKLAIAIVLVLVVCCCLCTLVFSISSIWANDMIGGLGNPYLFWP